MLRHGWRRVTLAVGVLSIALFVAAPAWASETVIGFDNLKAGEVVTNQYAGQGLELGKAETFKQPHPEHGDCGPPIVRAETATAPALSVPNYAELPTCLSAGPFYEGTYGALLGQPRGALSVQVSDIAAGTGPVGVELIGYDSGGKEVASGHGEASEGTWHLVTATLTGEARVSYFQIRTESAITSGKVAIDNLSFETLPPAEEPKPPPPSPPPSPHPSPPTASLALVTANPHAGALLTLSGAGSTPGSGRIISYGWDFNGDGKIDTSTGSNPIAHFVFAPGPHTVGLTVTNSTGAKTSIHLALNIPPPAPASSAPGGEGPCQPTYEEEDVHIIADCIEKLAAGGGYVIETRQIDLNGMMLVPKVTEGAYATFKILPFKKLGIASGTELVGPAVSVELLNTPIGDVALGGRDLTSEPIDLTFHAFHPFTIVAFSAHHRGPGARPAGAPSKTLLMAIAVGHECTGNEKKASCCPPKNQLAACATLPGDFPLTGQIQVYLSKKGQALFDAQVALDLKAVNFEATGAIEIKANLETGVELSSLQFEIGEASLAPIFKVKKASFVYYFPEYEEESKRDSWQAKGTITFGEEIVELEAELAFKKGNFQSASMKFKAEPGVPIYPGINLNEIGASVGVNPLAFGGSLGAKIAALLELEMAFKFREATSTELGFFGGQGKLSYKSDEIATLAADVYSDGYVDAQVTFNLHFPFDSKEPVIEVSGGAGFWDEPTSGLWQAKGNVYLKLWIISAEVAGLINNEYAAGCLHVGAEGIFGGGVQGRYRFSDGNISGGLFGNDNCSDQLKQYSEKPLVKHSGGFVKEESALFLPKPGDLLKGPLGSPSGAVASAAASGESESFSLPAGTMGEELRITSASGTPVVALLGPGGQTYTTPSAAGHLVTVPGQFMSAVAPNPHQVLVLLRHPKGGQWRIQAIQGSPAIATLETSEDVPPATVRVRLAHKHGRKWSLAYRIAHFVAGTKVRFVERGKDSAHVLGTVSRAKGTLAFTPAEALARSRTILAYMVDANGASVRELTVARYTAPAALRPGRPRKLRIARHGYSALVSWSAVAGAKSYRVKVRGSDGRLETFFRKAGRRSVSIANALPFESFTATVTALGPSGQAGHGATVTLKAIEQKRPVKRQARGKRKH